MNELAIHWASAVWTASWQGCLLIPLVWAGTRLIKGLPSLVVVWLWRLSLLKVWVALLLPIPIFVPAVVPTAYFQALSSSAASWVFAFSLVAFLAYALDLMLQRMAIRRLIGSATAYRGPVEAAGVQILISDIADAPMLCRCRGKYVIVLPAQIAEEPPPVQQMIVAHELAHLRFKDLPWNALMLLPQAALFFHPLVRLAAHELRVAQEAACDEAARRETGASASEYGRMLLRLAVGQVPCAQFGVASIAGDYRSLKVRIERLQPVRMVGRAWSIAFLLICIVSLPAWKLVEREHEHAQNFERRVPLGEGIAVAEAVSPARMLGPRAARVAGGG